MKLKQKEVAGKRDHMAIVEKPCNFSFECDKCQGRREQILLLILSVHPEAAFMCGLLEA